jgi:isocitrate/isopropylmalate dehydrogenase
VGNWGYIYFSFSYVNRTKKTPNNRMHVAITLANTIKNAPNNRMHVAITLASTISSHAVTSVAKSQNKSESRGLWNDAINLTLMQSNFD